MEPRGRKVIDGVEHKLCSGPGHDEPTWLPATEKYFYVFKNGKRAGYLTSRCRLCSNWDKLKSPGLSGRVPISDVKQYFTEGVNRIGVVEFARRTGISESTISYIIRGSKNGVRYKTVQKQIVRKCFLEVISLRRKEEVRHRKSIARGATMRGEPEREILDAQHDLYRPHGDLDAENRRRLRTM